MVAPDVQDNRNFLVPLSLVPSFGFPHAVASAAIHQNELDVESFIISHKELDRCATLFDGLQCVWDRLLHRAETDGKESQQLLITDMAAGGGAGDVGLPSDIDMLGDARSALAAHTWRHGG